MNNGFNLALKSIEKNIFNGLWNSAVELLKYLAVIHPSQGWMGFTGNTQTSYACGIYMFGKLEGIITQKNWNQSPRRRKIDLNEVAFLKNPYEGEPRAVKGRVKVSGDYGLNTSLEFLQSYSMPQDVIGLVMCTGTEYSEYLEQVRGVDVLSSTFEKAKEVIPKSFKPIK